MTPIVRDADTTGAPRPSTAPDAGRARRLRLRALASRLVFIVSMAVAFRAWAPSPTGVVSAVEAERFFFDRVGSVWIALAVATWLAWRRSAALRSIGTGGRPGAELAFWIPGLLCFLWSRLVDADDLMVPALIAWALGALVREKGLGALRALLLPVLVAASALPVPGPIHDEVMWAAQRLATSGAHLALETLGLDVAAGDMALVHEGHTFWVIESCSGLRSIELLTLGSILVRELLGLRSRRSMLLVVAAPPLAYLLNVLRIMTSVLLGSEGTTPEGHTVQGLVSVGVGVGLLFVLGNAMFGAPREAVAHASAEPAAGIASRSRSRLLGEGTWIRSALFGSLLALASVVIPPWPAPPLEVPSLEAFQQSRPGWRAEQIPDSGASLGRLPVGDVVTTRFVRTLPEGSETEAVELRIVTLPASAPRRSLRSSRLDSLRPEWRTGFVGTIHPWQIDREARVSISTLRDLRALSYRWRYSERSGWGAVFESALGLRRVPGWRAGPEIDVRVTTIIPGDGSPARRERARRVLDRFLTDFGMAFRQLEQDRS